MNNSIPRAKNSPRLLRKVELSTMRNILIAQWSDSLSQVDTTAIPQAMETTEMAAQSVPRNLDLEAIFAEAE